MYYNINKMSKVRRSVSVDLSGFYLYDHHLKTSFKDKIKKCGNSCHVRVKSRFLNDRAYVVIKKPEKSSHRTIRNTMLDDEIEIIFEGKVKRCGNSAHIGVPLTYLGKEAYIIIRDTESPLK
jgi:putative transposon-encoded protein